LNPNADNSARLFLELEMGLDRDWDEDRRLNKDIGWGWAYNFTVVCSGIEKTILTDHSFPWEWQIS